MVSMSFQDRPRLKADLKKLLLVDNTNKSLIQHHLVSLDGYRITQLDVLDKWIKSFDKVSKVA